MLTQVKKGLSSLIEPSMNLRAADHLGAVELLHPLLTQRAGIGALLFADFAETWVDRLVFGLGGIAVQDAAGTELLAVRLERA